MRPKRTPAIQNSLLKVVEPSCWPITAPVQISRSRVPLICVGDRKSCPHNKHDKSTLRAIALSMNRKVPLTMHRVALTVD